MKKRMFTLCLFAGLISLSGITWSCHLPCQPSAMGVIVSAEPKAANINAVQPQKQNLSVPTTVAASARGSALRQYIPPKNKPQSLIPQGGVNCAVFGAILFVLLALALSRLFGGHLLHCILNYSMR